MPKVKLPRKSTAIDMTAMCDVAFLLLAFFILTTKFKPDETLTVTTPKSVSADVATESDVVMVTIDKDGKVYFSLSDDNNDEKREVIEEVNTLKSLNLTEAEMKNFARAGSFVGVPFSQLKSYLQKSPDDLKGFKGDGIPVQDSASNELVTWMRAAQEAFQGQKMNLMVKGDNEAKYPTFKGVIDAFKRNEIFKFQMITDPEGAPEGTELYRIRAKESAAGAH